MNKVLLVLVAVVMVAAGWWMGRGTALNAPATSAAQSAPKSNSASVDAQVRLPVNAVLRVSPKMSVTNNASARAISEQTSAKAHLSPMMRAYVEGRDWPGLYAQALQGGDAPEAIAMRLALVERCATVTDRASPERPEKSKEERRAAFVAGLPPTHPETPARIAAYDALAVDACQNLKDTKITKAEIAELRAKAEASGDPVSTIRKIDCESHKSRDPSKPELRAQAISEEQFAAVKKVIASKNPSALRPAVGFLQNTFRNAAVYLGPDQEKIDQRITFAVADILGCQYGGNCERNLQRVCAYQGKCSVSNYADYLGFYELSPYAAQKAEAYRLQFTQMIESGDFSQLTIKMGEQDMQSVTSGSYFSCE
jgi:hypothetical protein